MVQPKLNTLRDGQACGETKWKYTCKRCGRPFLDGTPPHSQDEPICHRCYTGGQPGFRGPHGLIWSDNRFSGESAD
jgi:DNA-directed RNA polymerase subunit RPC12/RpoP